MRDPAIRVAELLRGAYFRALRPRDLIPRLACPVMIIHAGQDPFIPPEDAADMAESIKARSNERDVLWSVPDAGHVLGLAAVGPDEYRARIARFLETIRATAATTSTTTSTSTAIEPAATAAPQH
jgi:pimeloyl-ACP methyl ester carboxylesterase